MHLIESYATSCGLRIDKPFILEKYFPLDFERYITFSCSSEQPKIYDYWSDVSDIISPHLKSQNIAILQIGRKTDKIFPGAFIANGQTTPNHTAYILRNSLLHFGADDFSNQIASLYDRKIVSLYSNNISNNFRPYFGDRSKHKVMESPRNGNRPSCAQMENPKTINQIKPEEIAREILDLLDIKVGIKYKTLFMGQSYSNKIAETVPNQVVNVASLGTNNIIVRMDFLFNEEFLIKQLQACPCAIVTNKPISKKILIDFKNNIKELVYFIDEGHDPQFVNDLQKNAINYALFSKEDEAGLEKYKIHYMDYGIIHPKKPKINELLDKSENLFYKSSKLTLSNGKMYPSRYAYENDLPITHQSGISKMTKDPLLLEESDYFYFLEEVID
jgi:hypothetical protein